MRMDTLAAKMTDTVWFKFDELWIRIYVDIQVESYPY